MPNPLFAAKLEDPPKINLSIAWVFFTRTL